MERKVPLPCSEQSADRSVLSQINPVHRLLSHLFNIYFSIIPPLCLGLHNGPYTSGFST